MSHTITWGPWKESKYPPVQYRDGKGEDGAEWYANWSPTVYVEAGKNEGVTVISIDASMLPVGDDQMQAWIMLKEAYKTLGVGFVEE